ncbi:hypothetical protein B0O99DRAFT_690454 [Bisporella sp. PMI_857]|nr:hypothetical protein B0O99DRAFT_690454 [Bisporella sp. PMI_857]
MEPTKEDKNTNTDAPCHTTSKPLRRSSKSDDLSYEYEATIHTAKEVRLLPLLPTMKPTTKQNSPSNFSTTFPSTTSKAAEKTDASSIANISLAAKSTQTSPAAAHNTPLIPLQMATAVPKLVELKKIKDGKVASTEQLKASAKELDAYRKIEVFERLTKVLQEQLKDTRAELKAVKDGKATKADEDKEKFPVRGDSKDWVNGMAQLRSIPRGEVKPTLASQEQLLRNLNNTGIYLVSSMAI